MTPKQIKAILWRRFIEAQKIEMKPGEEPVLPKNLLGSVESHREIFMNVKMPELSCRCGKQGCEGDCRWELL